MCAAPKGNRFALGNNGGRPRIYASPEELELKVVEYFEEASENKWDLTITGLALYLGFCSREMLYEYQNRDEFSFIIKKARLAIENGYESGLHTFKYGGAVFALKNMGWKDKTEVETTDRTKTNQLDLSKATDEELAVIERLIDRSRENGAV